jgi:octaprenyl-diphosphate synthase
MFYSIAVQTANDLGDYAPEKFETAAKLNDAYSDFKHGKLTLPLIFALHNASDNDKKRLIVFLDKRNSLTTKELLEVSKIIANSGAVDYVKNYIKDCYQQAKQVLKNFPSDKRKWLSFMLIMLKSNKYYKSFEKLKTH